LPTVGATIARVTPSARLMATGAAFGLIAGATSIAALNGPSERWSLAPDTASTSTRPRREKPAMMPGVTHLPGRVDGASAGGNGDALAGRDDPAIADHDDAAGDRRRAVAEGNRATSDGDGLSACFMADGAPGQPNTVPEPCRASRVRLRGVVIHFTSPSPDCRARSR
jgi:hypothetical protein